tara:strand:- start:1308 stop:1868 length:561 start_codon:yes stop_codon:yes gene_type:complete
MFEKATERKVTKLDDTQLKTLSESIDQMLRIGGEIGNTEELLRKLKEQYRQLSEEDLPQKLAAIGMSELRLQDGSKITIDNFYSTRITEKNKEVAHQWLRDNGHGDIIKNDITVSFGKGEDETAQETMELLQKEGHIHNTKQREAVHPSTLKAFVKERIESGDTAFNLDVQKQFSLYQGKRTKITK